MELAVISNNNTFEDLSIVTNPTTTHSDDDFDDELGIPQSITLITVEGTPVAIESLEEIDCVPTSDIIPFNAVHQEQVKFKSFHRNVFIPGVEVKVTITGSERNLTAHFINPNLYTISLVHGNFSWVINKRYKHIHHLHQQLVLFRTSLNIPFPTKTHRDRRNVFKNNAVKTKPGKQKGALPRFPKKPEVLIGYDQLPNRINQLEDYLNNLLAISIYRNHPETIRFLEVSHLSFIYDLGIKGKEGMVRKRSGNSKGGCNCLGCFTSFICVRCRQMCRDLICSSFSERWFFIKDQCFGYVNPNNGIIGAVVLFDQGFEVSSGIYSTGLQKGIQVLTLSRQIIIKCWTRRKAKEWIQSLKDVANNQARDFTQSNPRQSFAPIRSNITACWLVDGAGYMSAVADAIEDAKEEVFIADWWLSPEIYLKRPATGDYWRLDKLLQRKAKQGIKIFVLLYKEVEMALGLNSYYSKQRLTYDSCDNIKVLRYPDHAKVGIFLWAHHEKLVIVDQTFAFLGGIDLCYGRWDDFRHRLTDLGGVTSSIDTTVVKRKSSVTSRGGTIYPTNYSKSNEPLSVVFENQNDTLPGPISPHSTSGHLLISNDQLEHVKGDTPTMERKIIFDIVKTALKTKHKDVKNTTNAPHEISSNNDFNNMTEADEYVLYNLDGSAKFWIGKDYVNFIFKDFSNLEAPFDDFIDRTTTPRMPWHDVGMCVQNAAARDIARHFIQRWNAVKLEKARFNSFYPFLIPKSYNDCCTRTTVLPMESECYKVTCQVLRSVSAWSCGFLESDTVEESIHEAYIDTITRSQHYIYIENQFFISLHHGNIYTRNNIADTLYNRILRAHREKAVFRVYVVMPLLPGFEGEVGDSSGASLHAITHWNYASISRGKDALLNRLNAAGIEDPSEYITFYSLRTHSVLIDEPITELIYVHSKLMIVDDKVVICGSANINDRSLIGKRDSEIAVIIEDEVFEDGIMNGNSFPCGMFASSLRRRLFKEHLGILGKEDATSNIDIIDPISENFYRDIWFETARKNTEVYEKVFHCIPSDKVETFAELRRHQEEEPLYASEPSIAEKLLESIKGHLVLLPLNFLSKEYLMPTAGSVEGMMPTSLWT